jgi:MFS family permease
VGFLIRPLGAFVFGWLGDRVGRKYIVRPETRRIKVWTAEAAG